jgi:hypothetical protein
MEPRYDDTCNFTLENSSLYAGFVGGRLNMRKRTRRGDIANFNFAREYLELKILREEVERIEVSSRTHPSKAAVAARDAQKANHCTRNRLQY